MLLSGVEEPALLPLTLFYMKKTLFVNPFPMPKYIMAKPAGAACNLDCSYCYYLEKKNLYKEKASLMMSDIVLEKYISDYIAMQPVPEVLFTWHGGEALLRDIDFYRKALKWQQLYGKGRKIENTLQTNGVLLNDEWCRFFKDNGFLIGISIDGPEHCHDIYRKDRAGQGSFRKVMRGIELLQKHDVPFNTLSVINNYNAEFPLEVYRFFKEIGSCFMQFAPVVERIVHDRRVDGLTLSPACDENHASRLAVWSVRPEQFGDFYKTIFDEWVRNDVGRYYVQLFDATLANMVHGMPGVCIFSRTCGHAAAMEFNGDLYACDHYVFPEYRLGNILLHPVFEMMLSEKLARFGNDKYDLLPQQCKACTFLNLCNGECPKNRIVETNEQGKNLNYLCSGYKAFFSHAQPYMEYMANQLQQGLAPANVMQWDKNK